MRLSRHAVASAAFVVVSLFGAQYVSAQIFGFGQQVVHMTGKIRGMPPGVLQVVDEKGDQWLVGYDVQSTQIILHATTTIGAVKPGMVVRLSNEFDAKGQALHPEDELEIITPNEMTRLGAFPDTTPAAPAAGTEDEKKEKSDEKKTIEPPAPKLEKEKPATKTGKRSAKDSDETEKGITAPAGPGTPYTVVGKVASLKDQVLTLAAGRATLHIPLAAELRVQIEQADYRLTREGDSVTVDGMLAPGAPGQILARRIEITAANPIQAPAPRQRSERPSRRSSSKKDKEKEKDDE